MSINNKFSSKNNSIYQISKKVKNEKISRKNIANKQINFNNNDSFSLQKNSNINRFFTIPPKIDTPPTGIFFTTDCVSVRTIRKNILTIFGESKKTFVELFFVKSNQVKKY